MRRLLAGAIAIGVVGSSGGLGAGIAAADPTQPSYSLTGATPVGEASTAHDVYAVGGARPPGIPWRDYTLQAGNLYFPNGTRKLIEYPAGSSYNWVPDFLAPKDYVKDYVSIGVAANVGARNLDTAIRNGTAPAVALGLSQGTLTINTEQARLADDPTAPPPDRLSFVTIGDPTGHHGFGASFLSGLFAPGSYIPVFDYTMPRAVDSQYPTTKIIAAYDGLSDFPDRPDNVVAVANAIAAGLIVHTPTAFSNPDIVPPQNIRVTVNSRGATTTTYLVPSNHLPLTLPLRFLGMSPEFVDQIDSVLQPMADAGYSRNDDPATRPVSIDPVHGMDAITNLGPATKGGEFNGFNLNDLNLNNINLPKLDVPKLDVPKLDVPQIELPKVELPQVELPQVELPKVNLNDFTLVRDLAGPNA